MIEDYPLATCWYFVGRKPSSEELTGLVAYHHKRVEDYDLLRIDIQFWEVLDTPPVIE